MGDVGDFGKYGLLRALCTPNGNDGLALRLGVVWYLTSDETHNNDGRHIGYLEPAPKNLQSFRACDPDLYDTLADIVGGNARNVSTIRRQQVLPEGTVFYERVLDLNGHTVRPNRFTRSQIRQEWVQEAVRATEGCDVVFVDPDNGIGSTEQACSRLGAKYVLLEELLPYFDRGQTLVIYHHLNRSTTADTQIKLSGNKLRDIFGHRSNCTAVRFRRGSARVFFLVSQNKHETTFEQRLAWMLATPWTAHFCPYLL